MAAEMDCDFEVVMEFGFEVPNTKFDKQDMKEWMKKEGEYKITFLLGVAISLKER
jgi:hypothetical protein